LTPEQRIAVWVDLMDACDELLQAGLRRQIGPTGDLRQAYRAWYTQHMEGHDRVVAHMLEELARREGGNGR
jgi:hypothetical protein